MKNLNNIKLSENIYRPTFLWESMWLNSLTLIFKTLMYIYIYISDVNDAKLFNAELRLLVIDTETRL